MNGADVSCDICLRVGLMIALPLTYEVSPKMQPLDHLMNCWLGVELNP